MCPDKGGSSTSAAASPQLKRETRSSRAKAQQQQQYAAQDEDPGGARPNPARPSRSGRPCNNAASLDANALEEEAEAEHVVHGRARKKGIADKDASLSGVPFAGQLGRAELRPATRCILLDRDLKGISPTMHMKLLKATPTVTARTLKNIIAGRLLVPAGDRSC